MLRFGPEINITTHIQLYWYNSSEKKVIQGFSYSLNTCFSLHVFVSVVRQLVFWHPTGTNLDHTILNKNNTALQMKSFSIETCSLSLAQMMLRHAKHVLLLWKVGSLMSINTSNAKELVWSWLGGAAFGGVLVLGRGVKYRLVFGWGICSWKWIGWWSMWNKYHTKEKYQRRANKGLLEYQLQ